jgi:hypothetical protein
MQHPCCLTCPPPAPSARLPLLCSYDPDLVVSVHPLMQHINCHVLRERSKRLGRARPTPFATVVTDFTTCHNAWFCKVRGFAGFRTSCQQHISMPHLVSP